MSEKKNHVLVNSLQRSGGTLLARLLDGHSTVASMPFEYLYAPQKVRFPNEDEVCADLNELADIQKTLLLEKNFKRLEQKDFFSKDLYTKNKLSFNYSDYLERVRKLAFRSHESADYDRALSLAFEAFFQIWRKEESSNPTVFVNHLSMACFAEAERFYSLVPGGRLIQTVRDPYSWYASMKRHFEVRDDDVVYLTSALHVWLEATLRGVAAQHLWPDQYKAISYADMVRAPEKTMRALAEWLSIGWEDVLTEPTIGGEVWGGNSAFGALKGVDSSVLEQWRDALTQGESENIASITGGMARDLETVLHANHSGEITVPALGGRVCLKPVNVTEFYRAQAQRMSLTTYNVFTRTIQRHRGRRYRRGIIQKMLLRFRFA